MKILSLSYRRSLLSLAFSIGLLAAPPSEARSQPSARGISGYDFSRVDSLPIRARPNTDETLRLPPDAPLLREMNVSRPDFYRLRYLLPAKFRLSPAEDFQDLIDEALLSIAATPAGKDALCVFGADSSEDVATYLQVSSAAARRIRQGCAGRKYPEAVVRRLRVMRAAHPPFQPQPTVPGKKFVFIFTLGERPAIEAYTTKNNTTYLVLSPATMNRAGIQRLIAHELAMSYDQLSRLGYLNNPSTIEDMGVSLAFGKGPLDPATFPELPRPALTRMRCAFRDPALRYAAAVQRAFLFEDAVAEQSTGSPAVATRGSCAQVLARNSVMLQAMSRVVAFDTGWYEAACGMAKTPALRVKEILERIKEIDATELRCNDRRACGGRPTLPLCELLLTPRIGPHAADLDGGGPRPSIGGGWFDSRANAPLGDLIESASFGRSLGARELDELGTALHFKTMDELYEEEDRLENRGRKEKP